MKRRSFTQSLISAAAGAALLTGFAASAQAEGLSNRPIRIVVPFGAGGVADVTARVVAQQLSTQLGQPVVIDNKPSAGGIVAADTVAKSAPDGHTLFLMSNGSAVTVNLFNSLPFDMVKDFTPVSTLGYFDIGVITDAKSPFKNLGELVSYAKANPGKLNLGSINVGSTQNLAAELFKTTAGIDAQIVPFNGTPAVVTALRGKQVDAAVEILTPIMGQINSKAVNLLAVTGEKRSPPAARCAYGARIWRQRLCGFFMECAGSAIQDSSRCDCAPEQRNHRRDEQPRSDQKAARAECAGAGQHARADRQTAAIRNQTLGRCHHDRSYSKTVRMLSGASSA